MCVIVDNFNIFIHLPKCAGSSVGKMINSKNLSNYQLQLINNKIKIGHFGIYPIIKSNNYNSLIKCHIILRDPIEWYVSLYFFVKNYIDHPYYIYANKDFKHFFYHVSNLKNKFININSHLEEHVNKKINDKPLFSSYKLFTDVLNDIKNYKYIDNHPDLNILLSERNIDEGLYTYWLLFLLAKINPLILFSQNKQTILNNLDRYIVKNVEIYSMNEIDKLLNNLNFTNLGINDNKSLNREKNYIEYYDENMLDIIKSNHKIFYKIKEILTK